MGTCQATAASEEAHAGSPYQQVQQQSCMQVPRGLTGTGGAGHLPCKCRDDYQHHRIAIAEGAPGSSRCRLISRFKMACHVRCSWQLESSLSWKMFS